MVGLRLDLVPISTSPSEAFRSTGGCMPRGGTYRIADWTATVCPTSGTMLTMEDTDQLSMFMYKIMYVTAQDLLAAIAGMRTDTIIKMRTIDTGRIGVISLPAKALTRIIISEETRPDKD